MSNVVEFNPNTKQPEPRGMIDIGTPHDGMVLFDACVPVALAAEFRRIADTAGIPVRNMID